MTKLTHHSLPSVAEWCSRYKDDIRVVVDWQHLGRHLHACDVWRIALPCRHFAAYHPWHRDGVPWWQRSARPGKPPQRIRVERVEDIRSILQAPAVTPCGTGKLLVLDGNHRIRDLSPDLILLDVLAVHEPAVPAFGDFMNPWWRP